MFPAFITDLYEQLRPVVTIPQAAFRRWFLAECIPFVGSFHLLQQEGRFSWGDFCRREKFHLVVFLLAFAAFLPFQTACALGMDQFTCAPSCWVRFFFYYLEVYLLAWIPAFVIRALLFIFGFVRLPVRYFIGMPDSVSLKPLGTFYLKIATVGFCAFTLFTFQHYLFQTYVTVTLASIGYILIVYLLFFLIMLFSQALIMVSLDRHRQRAIVDFSYHIEDAYKVFIEKPTPDNFNTLANHKLHLDFLKRELKIGGLTKYGYLWFLSLALAEIAIMILYFILVKGSHWIQ
ncbi:MAG: hypothetical protein PHV34_20955 [Verrucomicrobiae bacterium]|nr:hypothetical protein [Verrucomicrobiae bacterium]